MRWAGTNTWWMDGEWQVWKVPKKCMGIGESETWPQYSVSAVLSGFDCGHLFASWGYSSNSVSHCKMWLSAIKGQKHSQWKHAVVGMRVAGVNPVCLLVFLLPRTTAALPMWVLAWWGNAEDKCGLWQTLVSSSLLSPLWLVLQSNPLNIHTRWQAQCLYPNSFHFVNSNYHPSFFVPCLHFLSRDHHSIYFLHFCQ